MKSKACVIPAAICLVSLAIGCSLLISSPSSVAHKYWIEGVEGDNKHMEDLFSESRKQELGADKIRDMTLALGVTFGNVKSITNISEELTGNTAEVRIKVNGEGEDFPLPIRFILVKEDNEWRIDHIYYGSGRLL